MTRAALILGARGVTGTPLAECLLRQGGWNVYGVSRSAPVYSPGTPTAAFRHLPVDLTDRPATRVALAELADVTHVFYCANHADGRINAAMMENALDAVEAAAPGFANLNLMQGTKYYG